MNKKLKQILDRYPMLEADRNYIANLANTGSGSGCNSPIVIDVTNLHSNGTPVPLSRDTAKQIFDGALVILKDSSANVRYLVTGVSPLIDYFPCSLILLMPTANADFHNSYYYNDEYQQLEVDGGPV